LFFPHSFNAIVSTSLIYRNKIIYIRCFKLFGVAGNYNSQAKKSIKFVMSNRPSVYPIIRGQVPPDGFRPSFIPGTFRKISPENLNFLKSDTNISGNLLEELIKFRCCPATSHQLAIKALSFSSQYCCVFYLTVAQQYTHTKHCCISTRQRLG